MFHDTAISEQALRHLEARRQVPTIRPVYMFDNEARRIAEEAASSLCQQFDNEVPLDAITPKAILGDGVWFPGIVLADGKEAQVRTDANGNPREVHFVGSNAFGANIPDGHRWSIDLVNGVVTSEHW